MPSLSNADIAALFDKLADLLEIQGGDRFRVRAYRNASQVIASHPHAIADMAAEGKKLSGLPGIGEGIAERIQTIVDSGGRLPELDRASEQLPHGVTELLDLPGLGPERVQQLYHELGIDGVSTLEKAAKAGRIAELDGFGDKLQESIRASIREHSERSRRTRLAEAEDRARPLLDYLESIEGVKDVVIAGSYRRRRETVGDLDVLITHRRGARVMERLRDFDGVKSIVSMGSTRASLVLRGGLQVDVRVMPQVAFGAAMHYFTGSQAHTVAVRRIAVGKGLKLNEYGLFRGDKRIAGRTEEAVFKALDLAWIPPELRENSGEIEAAGNQGRLPHLIEARRLRGDLHAHTQASDGRDSLRGMAEAAAGLGYEYLAITDHSQEVRVANGLDPKRLRRHLQAIDRLNDDGLGVHVLKSCEVDILEDGQLDLPDDLLDALDVVVATVHSHFDLPRERQTERVLRALEHSRVHILAHPTTRLVEARAPIELDMERVMDVAARLGCAMEVNAQPARLDLNAAYCRMAKEKGVKLVISSDAHSAAGLERIRFGVDQARRGWVEADQILNTLALKDFLKALR